MITATQKGAYIKRARVASTTLINTLDEFRALKTQYDKDGTGGLASAFVIGDFIGEDLGLIPTDIANIWLSLAAILAVFDAGHAANFYALKE